jgi:nucleotide-binding universal stress UspA family protein
MYSKILITLDATKSDKAILDHIRPLARQFHSRLILLHVADGWAARRFGAEAISPEVTEDRAYLESLRGELAAEGFADVQTALAYGEPSVEIVRWVEKEGCDLIAMSTHGHRLIGDLLFGTTASKVQHRVNVPVLLLRAKG